MKFQVTLKTPDAVSDAVKASVTAKLKDKIPESSEEFEFFVDDETQKLMQFMER